MKKWRVKFLDDKHGDLDQVITAENVNISPDGKAYFKNADGFVAIVQNFCSIVAE